MSLTYDCSDKEQRADGLVAAAAAIERGELVVLPTDTVYGLAADAFSPEAVQLLFDAKERGRNVPSPVLVGSWNGLDGLVLAVSGDARELIEAFWPGGLTVIVEHAPSLSWDLGDTRGTVAVRMPAHPVAIDLLTRTGPLAVTSANKHGQPPPATAAHARKQLGDAVTVYLDADVADGKASTIVDLTGPTPILRRAGAISAEQLREVVPDLIVPEEKKPESPADEEPVEQPVEGEQPVADESAESES
jgi:tRNA threonylcarbamoyl adenosine modification protein (Sua5/YciO/YrdC/YwlC family)